MLIQRNEIFSDGREHSLYSRPRRKRLDEHRLGCHGRHEVTPPIVSHLADRGTGDRVTDNIRGIGGVPAIEKARTHAVPLGELFRPGNPWVVAMERTMLPDLWLHLSY